MLYAGNWMQTTYEGDRYQCNSISVIQFWSSAQAREVKLNSGALLRCRLVGLNVEDWHCDCFSERTSSPIGVAKVVLGFLIYEAEQLVHALPTPLSSRLRFFHCRRTDLIAQIHNVMIWSELSA